MMASIPTTYNLNEPSDRYSGTLLGQRNAVYKFGILCIIVACALFVVGFSTSNWLEVYMPDNLVVRSTTSSYSSGGFGRDDPDDDSPTLVKTGQYYSLWNGPKEELCEGLCHDALTASRVMLSLCLLGYIACIAFIIFENVRVVDLRTYHSRKVELALFVTGGLCWGGLFSFSHFFSTSIDSPASMIYAWSMYLVSLSSTILFISWLLMLCGNKKPGVAVVVTAPANIQMAQYSSHSSRGRVIQTPQPITGGPQKPGPSAYAAPNQPLLPPQGYPPYPQDAPPAYSLPPPYPNPEQAMSGLPPAPPYSTVAVPPS